MRSLLYCLVFFSFSGCGVKGRPLPPLTAPVLGRGEPTYSKATKDIRINEKKKNLPTEDDDESDDKGDFSDEAGE